MYQEAHPNDRLSELLDRLERVLPVLETLAEQGQVQEWYSTADVAKVLGRDPYTVRQWCRFGRVRAEKRRCGRGKSQEWIISHEELGRIRSEGLLPDSRVTQTRS